jgi:HSP20 family protein
MTIHRYEPWSIMNRLHRDLDRLLVPAIGEDSPQNVIEWAPHVDIREEKDRFVLHADLPGVEAKNIEVSLDKGILTLRGHRELETRDEKAGFRRIERVSGEFFRRFTLPDTADSQSVRAKHANGVLEVIIPKQAQVMPRRIEVEAA